MLLQLLTAFGGLDIKVGLGLAVRKPLGVNSGVTVVSKIAKKNA